MKRQQFMKRLLLIAFGLLAVLAVKASSKHLWVKAQDMKDIGVEATLRTGVDKAAKPMLILIFNVAVTLSIFTTMVKKSILLVVLVILVAKAPANGNVLVGDDLTTYEVGPEMYPAYFSEQIVVTQKENPCNGLICFNGGTVVFTSHRERSEKYRCFPYHIGKYCKKYNPYKIDPSIGIIHNELFLVRGEYNYAKAQNVCEAFCAHQPSEQDITRIAREAKYGVCKSAWVDGGRRGYPEYNGNCHKSRGSTHTGYFSFNCCSNRITTFTQTWCLKKNIDFCEPGWHGNQRYCYLFRDDELVTMKEAMERCAAKNAVLAKIRFNFPSFQDFIKRVCPICRSMYVGVEKVGVGEWKWIPEYVETSISPTSWNVGEPREENNCAEYNTEFHALTTLPCNTPRGYMCRYTLFA